MFLRLRKVIVQINVVLLTECVYVNESAICSLVLSGSVDVSIVTIQCISRWSDESSSAVSNIVNKIFFNLKHRQKHIFFIFLNFYYLKQQRSRSFIGFPSIIILDVWLKSTLDEKEIKKC